MVDCFKSIEKIGFSGVRDKVVSKIVSLILAHYLRSACHMLNLTVDSKTRTIHIEVLPAGEKEPIRFEVARYAFVEENGTSYLAFEEIKASREWMDRAIETFLPEKRLPLPDNIPARLLKTVME